MNKLLVIDIGAYEQPVEHASHYTTMRLGEIYKYVHPLVYIRTRLARWWGEGVPTYDSA